MRAFFLGLLIGLIGGLFVMQNHLVRTSAGVVVIPRTNRPPLRSTYVDVRHWSISMWEQYPEVAAAAVNSGRSDLITQNSLGNFLNNSHPVNRSTAGTQAVTPTAAKLITDVQSRLQNISNDVTTLPSSQPNVNQPAINQSAAPAWPTSIAGPGTSLPETARSFPLSQPASPATQPYSPPPQPAQRSLIDGFGTMLGDQAPFPNSIVQNVLQQPDLILPNGVSPGTLESLKQQIPLPSDVGSMLPNGGIPSGEAQVPPEHDEEWVKGLLKSLIPSASIGPGNLPPGTPTISAPTPATAAGDFKRVSLQEFQGVVPQPAPVTVRPF